MVDPDPPRRRLGLPPSWAGPSLSVVLPLSGLAAWLVLEGRPLAAGGAVLAGGAALVAASLSSRAWRQGGLAVLVTDRVFDAAPLAALAWASRGAPRVSAAALAALGASYLAAYERARGRSLGYRFAEAPSYRAVTAALLGAGLLTGWAEPLLWALGALGAAAALARGVRVASGPPRRGAQGPAPGGGA
jgi:hypothetical protein